MNTSVLKFTLRGILLLVAVLVLSQCAARHKMQLGQALKACTWEASAMGIDGFTASPEIKKKLKEQSVGMASMMVVGIITEFSQGKLPYSLGDLDMSLALKVRNPNEDDLKIDSLTANLHLDSIMQIPLQLREPVILKAKDSAVLKISALLPLKPQIFDLKKAATMTLKGELTGGLAHRKRMVKLPLEISRKISEEEKTKFIDQSRNMVIESLIQDWVQKIK